MNRSARQRGGVEDLAADAKRLSILFDYSIATEKEVIQWADQRIAAMDSPPEQLLQLSMTAPKQTGEFITHLHALGEGVDFWEALRAAMPRVYEHLLSHPEDAERIAVLLYRSLATVGYTSEVPKDFNFAWQFEDDLALARQSIWGSTKKTRARFMEELKRFC